MASSTGDAGRSAPRGAVFLSYASQDTEAAKKIADALRAAGVEVWFDQNELVGGDAWDQKIRGQIASCALFVPIISANTQARLEGYFRREWKQAAARTHDMADEKAFLLPVVIDDTRDASAKVPPEFKAVQWTRLAGGEAPAAFVQRVKKLLAGEEQASPDVAPGRAPAPEPAPMTSRRATPLHRTPGFWIGLALCAGLLAYQLWRPATKPAASSPPVATEAAGSELVRVRARIIPDRWQREDFAVVSAMLDRLIQANPDDSEAWALRSIINSLQVVRNFDAGTKSLEAGKADADRALRLAPGSPLGEIAFGLHLVAMTSRGGDAAACRPYIDRAVAALPADALTRYAKLVSHWFGYEFASVRRVALDWLEVEPQASFPAWILSQSYLVQRQPAEAEKWAERALVDSGITGVRAYYSLFEAKYYLRADLRAAREALDRMPATGRAVHRVVHARWLLAMAGQKWDEALQELSRVPEPFLFDRSYHGPKALLAGFAHQRAGRTEAAAAQFREAERLLRERLAADPDNEELHGVLAITLACANRGADARSELAMVEPLVRGRAPTLQRGSLALTMAQTYAVLRDPAGLATWLRLLFAEPSQFPFTPASIRLDPRFAGALEAPEVQSLLQEFAGLDRADAAKADDKSVAVLPFTNLSGDKEQEYFSDGLTDEILTALTNERDLRVVARTSAFAFKGKSLPVPDIARALHVAQVVEGSVRKSGAMVKITVTLTRAHDGFSEPLGTFTEKLDDIFALQEKVARAVVQKLTKRAVTAEGVTVLTKNPEAYDLYLKARAEMRNPGRRREKSGELRERWLQTAVALDPNFAAGWAELAMAHAEFYNSNWDRTPQRLAQVKAAIDQAARLAPELPELFSAQGRYFLLLADYPQAAKQFEKRIQLQPSDANAYYELAVAQRRQGRWTEARENFVKTSLLDPGNSGVMRSGILKLLENARCYEEAAQWQQRLVELQPESAGERFDLAYLSFKARGSTREVEDCLAGLKDSPSTIALRRQWRMMQGDYAEAIRLDRQLSPDNANRSAGSALQLAMLMAASGDLPGARALLAKYPAELKAGLDREPDNPSMLAQLAAIEAVLGHRDEALRVARQNMDLLPESLNPWDGASRRAMLAFVLAWTGDKEGALAEYARLLRTLASSAMELTVHEMRHSPRYWPLQGDPRFQALLADPKNNEPLL